MDNGTGDAIDRDLLERYLLDRITPEERLLVEEMLRTDETWRIALLEEQRLASAVRRAGRDEMKARLRSRVGETARFTLRPRMVAAAAVIVTVIGIGVLFRWPIGGPGRTGEPPSVASDMEQQRDELRQIEKKDVPAEHAQQENARPATSPSPAAGGGASPPLADRLSKVTPAGQPTTATSAEAERRAEASDDKALRESRVAAPQAGAAAGKVSLEESDAAGAVAWVTATVTGTRTDVRGREANELGAQADESKAAARKAEGLDAAKGKSPAPPAEPRVSQMPLSNLPESQQRFQAAIPAGQMQARLSRRDGTMEITLYPDEPFSGDELAHAQVRRIGADSIVVEIGRQQVGMKVPGEFGRR